MNVRDKFAYSVLHPLVLCFHLLAQIIIGMFYMHPIVVTLNVLSACLLCFTLYGRKFLKELKFFIPFYLIIAFSNPLFSHNGGTVLFFLNGKPITYEATIYGFVSSGMFIGIMLWCRVWSGVMTEEKIIYLVGKRFPKIGLVLSVSLRMIPRFRAEWEEMKEAQISLGFFAEKGFVVRVKNALKLFSALTTKAMEYSIETGMAMSARGYGLKNKSSFSIYRFTQTDGLFLFGNFALFTAFIVGASLGYVDYIFYPKLSPILCSNHSIIFFILFAAQSSMLLLTELKEELVWKYSQSRI